MTGSVRGSAAREAAPAVRRAGAADIDDLVRLRRTMYESWGQDASGARWQQACRRALTEQLASPDFVAFLGIDAEGVAVSSGVGWIEHRLPGPGNHTGLRGHIASMSTEERARRQGHARRVLEALMGWFTAQGVKRIDLRATTWGEPLYSSVGFTIPSGLPMTWHAEDVAASSMPTPTPLTDLEGPPPLPGA